MLSPYPGTMLRRRLPKAPGFAPSLHRRAAPRLPFSRQHMKSACSGHRYARNTSRAKTRKRSPRGRRFVGPGAGANAGSGSAGAGNEKEIFYIFVGPGVKTHHAPSKGSGSKSSRRRRAIRNEHQLFRTRKSNRKKYERERSAGIPLLPTLSSVRERGRIAVRIKKGCLNSIRQPLVPICTDPRPHRQSMSSSTSGVTYESAGVSAITSSSVRKSLSANSRSM